MNYIYEFENWLNEEFEYSEQTVRTYKFALNNLIKWYESTDGKPFIPGDITTLHIHDFKTYMDKVEKKDPNTINKNIYAIKTYYKLALNHNIVSYDPTQKIRLKRINQAQGEVRWLSKKEVASIFHAIEVEYEKKIRKDLKGGFKPLRDRAICRLMQGAGLRISEVFNLHDSDISLKNKCEDVTIRNGKGDAFRIVPLNRDVIEALSSYLDARGTSKSGYLFESTKGTQLTEPAIRKIVKKYAKKAGIVDVTPHRLRHTFGKLLADQGVSLNRIAYLLGHNSLESTRIYIMPSKKDARKDVNSISEIRDDKK